VLFDLRCVQNTIGPWRIVVRFRDFPTDAVIRCSTRETAEKMYMHTLKQALFVLQGNTRSFNAMVLEQQQLLWEGANSGSRGIFESVADDLRGLEAVKCIPIRILYRRRGTVASHREHVLSREGINVDRSVKINESTNQDNHQPSFICIQKPVYAYTNDGKVQESLLSDVLDQFIPGILSDGPSRLPQCISVLIQGIDVPLDAPLWQLWKLCAHADFFLYVVVSDTS
jgi:Autophagy protein Apg5